MQKLYNLDSFIDESRSLKEIRVSAESRKIPVIDDMTGRFLEAICFLKKPSKILEIGCGIGYSTYFLVKHFGTGIGEKTCPYRYTGLDLNKDRITEAGNYIDGAYPGYKNSPSIRLEFIHGHALKILQEIEHDFNFVFIDAAKFEYPAYIHAVENNLEEGCIIIADNIFYSGKIFEKNILKHDKNSIEGIKGYIGYMKSCKMFKTGLFDIADGISLSIYLGNK